MKASNQIPKEFPVVDFKSVYTRFISVSSLAFIIYMIWLAIYLKDVFIIAVVAGLLIYSIYMVIYATTSKIILTENEITKQTIFRTTSIGFNEAKSFDVYLQQGSARAEKLNSKNIDKTSFLSLKFLYISTDFEFNSSIFKSKDYKTIKIHFIPELYKELKQKIKIS